MIHIGGPRLTGRELMGHFEIYTPTSTPTSTFRNNILIVINSKAWNNFFKLDGDHSIYSRILSFNRDDLKVPLINYMTFYNPDIIRQPSIMFGISLQEARYKDKKKDDLYRKQCLKRWSKR